MFYRLSHWLWKRKWRLLARFLSHVGKILTAIEIHPGAHIGRRFVIDHGTGAVVDLTGAGAEALALQPVHGRPMLEGLRKPMGGSELGQLRRRADGWLAGTPQPGLAVELATAGFRHVLVVDRDGTGQSSARAVLHDALGPPVYPGIYAIPGAPPSTP